MIDLHQHSTFSDGSLSVEQLINLSYEYGVRTISVSDHDTLSGQKPASDIAMNLGIKYIYGIELSVPFKDVNVHLLAYFPELPNFSFMKKIKHAIFIDYVKNKRDLKHLKTSYTSNLISEVTRIIKNYNGIAVLAHPILYLDVLDELIRYIHGLEVVHPSHSNLLINRFISIAETNNLYMTLGSDYHSGDLLSTLKFINTYKNISIPFLQKLEEKKR